MCGNHAACLGSKVIRQYRHITNDAKARLSTGFNHIPSYAVCECGQLVTLGQVNQAQDRVALLITYCGLETLCRVYEKINVLAEEEIEEW